MRIISWNIQQGGGQRVPHILTFLKAQKPNAIVLSEVKGTAASQQLAAGLRSQGYIHQASTVDPGLPKRYALLAASKTPLQSFPISPLTDNHRGLGIHLIDTNLSLFVVHVPNRDRDGRKWQFHQQIMEFVRDRHEHPSILLGDTNTGKPNLDEENAFFNQQEGQWMDDLASVGWSDAWRKLYGDKRVYSWRSPSHNNGFRLDQAFLNKPASSLLKDCQYLWTEEQGYPKASDHAAIVVDLQKN